MEYNNDFRYDLKVGQIGEEMLGELLSSAKVEVKKDSWIYRSGNIAVEFESRGKPSGIAKTEADWWCFIFSAEFEDKMLLMVETNKLKLIARKYYRKDIAGDGKYIKKMGDSNTSKAVLIPLNELMNINFKEL